MNNNVFGKRLKMLREEANMSRATLAEKLNTSLSAISQYETGSRIPSDEIKISIAKIFDVSLDYLMGLSPIKNEKSFNAILPSLSDLTEEELRQIKAFINFIIHNPPK